MSRRVLPVLLAAVLVALVLATLLTGEAIYTVPAMILVGIIGLMALGEFGLKKRLEHRHDGDVDAAMADSEDPIPSTHLAKDDETALGDTPRRRTTRSRRTTSPRITPAGTRPNASRAIASNATTPA